MNDLKQASHTFSTNAGSNDQFNNTVANINFKHTFDEAGKELTADIDFGIFNNKLISNNTKRYFEMNGDTQRPTYILNGDQDGKLTIKIAKADYVRQSFTTKLPVVISLKVTVCH